MSIEATETTITTNRKLRNFDAALEKADSIRMVVSDADTGNVCAALWDDGAVEAAERLAAEYGFTMQLREDSDYGRRAFFEPNTLDF
jgi:hypothetical protein